MKDAGLRGTKRLFVRYGTWTTENNMGQVLEHVHFLNYLAVFVGRVDYVVCSPFVCCCGWYQSAHGQRESYLENPAKTRGTTTDYKQDVLAVLKFLCMGRDRVQKKRSRNSKLYNVR